MVTASAKRDRSDKPSPSKPNPQPRTAEFSYCRLMKPDLFDNSPSKIAHRTFELYPLDILRKDFTVTGDTDDAISKIIAANSIDDLKEDFVRLMGHCKQHIYLFSHDLKTGALSTVFFGHNVEFKNVVTEDNSEVDHEYP